VDPVIDDGRLASAALPVSGAEWQQLCGVMNGYIYSQALVTACDFDVFTTLSRHPGATQDDLQKLLGLSPYCTRILMLACCATGLVLQHVQRRCTAHLTDALKENRNVGLKEFPGEGTTLYERLAQYPDVERLFHDGMGAYTRLSPKILDLPEFSSMTHLLDVGGGDGSNAIGLCERLPDLRVTLIDRPSVVEIARQRVARAGLADRIWCAAVDIFEDPWPAGCTGVLMSHLVEIFSHDKIDRLYRRAFDVLPPGGRLVVWTIMASDSETGSLQAAKSSIYFLCAASGEGMAYPAKDHDEALRRAGFSAVRRHLAVEFDHGALIAVR
jgi:methyltransferase